MQGRSRKWLVRNPKGKKESEMLNIKKYAMYALAVLVILAVAVYSGYMLGSGHTVGPGDSATQSDYQRVKADLASIHTQLDGISKAVDSSVKGIGNIEERIGRSQISVSESITRIGTDTDRLRQVESRLGTAQQILQGKSKQP